MSTRSFDGCGDRDKKSKSVGDGDEDRIINGDGDEESKILPKFDPLPSLIRRHKNIKNKVESMC